MNREFLYEMIQTPSPSGAEYELQKKVIRYMKPHVDTFLSDATGNVISVLNPSSPCKVLLAGHVDEIGLMVTKITESGKLRVVNVGGIRVPLYLGQKVRVLTESGVVHGVVGVTPLLLDDRYLQADDLFVDIGATTKEEACQFVKPGSYLVVDTDYRELLNDCICGRALDNRLGAFIVIEALRRAKELGTTVGTYSATTVGEETTLRGAIWAAKHVKPTLAIVVDVTYATDYEDAFSEEVGDIRVGGGPVLANGSIIHPLLNKTLEQLADQWSIPLQYEAAPGRTGTDGDAIHLRNDGIPLALVSIPIRYMHSGSEVGSLKDVELAIELIARFLLRVEEGLDLSPYKNLL